MNFKRALDRIVVWSFLLFLALPALEHFARVDRRQRIQEKRTMAAMPAFHGNFGVYFSGLNAYLNDNFGFRQRLIGLHNRCEIRFLHRSPVDKVVLGSDGWLFYGGEGVPDYTRRARSFTPDELSRWAGAMDTRNRLVQANGGRYLFLVVPNKEEIYPDLLPFSMAGPADDNALACQILRALKIAGVAGLDLRQSLRDGKNRGQLVFYKTDTHWNDLGSMVGCREILRVLGRSVEPLNEADYVMDQFVPRMADLTTMLGADLPPEMVSVINPVGGWHWVMQVLPFPPSKPGLETQEMTNPRGQGTLLFFGDSFGVGATRFLAESFGHVIFVRNRALFSETVRRYHPDVVIDEYIERVFPQLSPDSLRVNAR